MSFFSQLFSPLVIPEVLPTLNSFLTVLQHPAQPGHCLLFPDGMRRLKEEHQGLGVPSPLRPTHQQQPTPLAASQINWFKWDNSTHNPGQLNTLMKQPLSYWGSKFLNTFQSYGNVIHCCLYFLPLVSTNYPFTLVSQPPSRFLLLLALTCWYSSFLCLNCSFSSVFSLWWLLPFSKLPLKWYAISFPNLYLYLYL